MSIGKICKCEVITAPEDMCIDEAAKLMKKHNIGDIVITSSKDDGNTPIGILTDRGIVIKIIANDLDVKKLQQEMS